MYRVSKRTLSAARGRGLTSPCEKISPPGCVNSPPRFPFTYPEETKGGARLQSYPARTHVTFDDFTESHGHEDGRWNNDNDIRRVAPPPEFEVAGASFSGYHTPHQVVSVYEENAGLWLMPDESIFRLKGIVSENQKYELAVGVLTSDT